MNQLLVICALVALVSLVLLPGKGTGSRGLVEVPVQDGLGRALNNVSVSAVDLSSRDRKEGYRRRGDRVYWNRRGRPYRRGSVRWEDDDDISDSRYDSRYSDETYESDSRHRDTLEDSLEYDRHRPSSWRRLWRRRPYARRTVYTERTADPCALPRRRGTCFDLQRRWYFHHKMSECRAFTYSGCRGNRNNFISEKNCQDSCAGGHQP